MQPRDPDALEFLTRGRLEIQGRLVDASNATLFCSISADGVDAECVYKPVSGERPLWDFPDGTLAGREVGTFLLSQASGLHVVPPTVLRPGPFGPGMVQLWVDTKEGDDLVDVVAPQEVGTDWRVVLHAHDRFGDPAVLAHADHPGIRAMAAFDVVANNADRKSGHCLWVPGDRIYAIDHGLTFHAEPKLRTVIWDFGQEPIAPTLLEDLRRAIEAGLPDALAALLDADEQRALKRRARGMIRSGHFPVDQSGLRYPWPLV